LRTTGIRDRSCRFSKKFQLLTIHTNLAVLKIIVKNLAKIANFCILKIIAKKLAKVANFCTQSNECINIYKQFSKSQNLVHRINKLCRNLHFFTNNNEVTYFVTFFTKKR